MSDADQLWPLVVAMIRERDAWAALAATHAGEESDGRIARAERRIRLAQAHTEATMAQLKAEREAAA